MKTLDFKNIIRGVSFGMILVTLFVGITTSVEAQNSTALNRFLNRNGNAGTGQPGVLDIFEFQLAPKALQIGGGLIGGPALGTTNLFNGTGGVSNPIIFRSLGTSIFDDIIAYKNAAFKTLFVGFPSIQNYTTGDPLLQVDGIIRIEGLADPSAGAFVELCVIDTGVLQRCDSTVRFTANNISGDTGAANGGNLAADFDGDGDIDILVARNGSTSRILFNNGSGVFTIGPDLPVATGIYPPIAGDLDGDGDIDIYQPHHGQNRILTNDGSGGFGLSYSTIPGDSNSTWGAAIADFNLDGLMDIYVANNYATNRIWLKNTGPGYTSYSIPGNANTATRRPAVGDFNGDGKPDLYVPYYGASSPGNLNRLFINTTPTGFGAGGNPSFTMMNIPNDDLSSIAASTGDVDGDGDIDIHVANAGQNRLWINDGNANFTENNISGDGSNTSTTSMVDIDSDGDLDIYVTHASNVDNKLFINDGNGNFTRNDWGQLVDQDGRSAAFGDFNGDGKIDIHVMTGGQNKLWIQD